MVSLGPTGLLMKNLRLSNGTPNHQRRLDDLTDPQVWHSRWRKLKPLVRLPGRLSVRTLRIRGFWAFSGWMHSGPKVWIRGLLRKGLGLCHGIPGNGFALLKLHPTGGGNPKKIFASRISVVFLVGSRGSVAESCAAFRSLCSGVRHLNGDTQDKLNKPRLWMFGLQHYYAISRITKVQKSHFFCCSFASVTMICVNCRHKEELLPEADRPYSLFEAASCLQAHQKP